MKQFFHRIMRPTLLKWQDTMSLVIIKSDHPKAFCPGGDVRALVHLENVEKSMTFIREQYSLINFISTYRLPYVALINGITMGAGVGLSIHGKYRVATEKTIFAMPETLIGLFPDIGGSYFLPRLPGQLGMYLGLTGDKLKGKGITLTFILFLILSIAFYSGRDVLFAGVATHFCESARLSDLEAALVTCSSTFDIEATLNKFCPIDPNAKFSLQPYMDKINKYFSENNVEKLIRCLNNDNSDFSRGLLKVCYIFRVW